MIYFHNFHTNKSHAKTNSHEAQKIAISFYVGTFDDGTKTFTKIYH